MWTHEMFRVEKPVIALLHLDALPGDPGFCGSMDTVLDHARQDLAALQNGGVDGILFANEFSLPYQPVADIAVISAMAYIIGNLKEQLRLPFGVNVVKNPIATIDLAAATGAKFGRSCFSGAYMGEYGLYTSNSGEAIRHRKALDIPDMKLLFKVNPEADCYLVQRDIKVVARMASVFPAPPPAASRTTPSSARSTRWRAPGTSRSSATPAAATKTCGRR